MVFFLIIAAICILRLSLIKISLKHIEIKPLSVNEAFILALIAIICLRFAYQCTV